MEKKRKKAKYGMGLVLVVFFLLFIPGHYNILQVDAAEQTAKVPVRLPTAYQTSMATYSRQLTQMVHS